MTNTRNTLRPWPESKHVGLAIGVAAALSVALFAFALAFHTVPLPHGGEADGYVRSVGLILEGRFPTDPFRPQGYNFLAAAIAWVTGDIWTSGIAVSCLAAGGLCLVAFLLARRAGGATAGWLAFGLVAVNGGLLTQGMLFSTDAAFATACGLYFLTLARVVERPTLSRSFLVGLAFGAAYFIRYPILAMSPAALVALWQGGRTGLLARICACTGGSLLALAPHCWATWRRFGRPLYDESWRHLVLKFHGNWDGRSLSSSDWTGYADVLSADPMRILTTGASDVVASYGGPIQGLLAPAPGSIALGSVVMLLALVGAVRSVRAREPAALGFAFVAIAYPAIVVFALHAKVRYLLPIVPLYATWAAQVLVGWRRPGVVLGLGLLAWQLVHLPAATARFVDRHPHAEIQAARDLVAQHEDVFLTVASYSGMDLFLTSPVVHFHSMARDEAGDPATVHAKLFEEAKLAGARYILLGRRTLLHETWAALRQFPLPEHLQLVSQSEDVLVLRPVFETEQYFEPLEVSPNPWTSGPVELEVRLTDPTSVERLGLIGVAVSLSPDQTHYLPVTPGEDGVFRHVLREVRLGPGRYSLKPYAIMKSGKIVFGPSTSFVVN